MTLWVDINRLDLGDIWEKIMAFSGCLGYTEDCLRLSQIAITRGVETAGLLTGRDAEASNSFVSNYRRGLGARNECSSVDGSE